MGCLGGLRDPTGQLAPVPAAGNFSVNGWQVGDGLSVSRSSVSKKGGDGYP
jgi:hypothetical protein